MTPLTLFGSTFVLVFTLGLQSQLVNRGHHIAAFINSLCIGVANLILFKLAPGAAGWDIVGFLSGGPFGIVFSMWFYRRYFHHRGKP